MGGNSTKYNKVGGIHIELEKYVFNGGEVINGTIHISTTEALSQCYLEFQFKGKEITHWIERHSNGRSTVTYHFDGNLKFCQVRYQMLKWEVSLNPGHYSIPFSFVTPTGIPGSFQYIVGPNRGNIVYSIYGKIVSPGEKLKGKANVHIFQSPNLVKSQINLAKEAVLSTFCCSPKGILKLQVHWPQDTYSPMQLIECLVEIDNSQSLLAVKSLSTRLCYRIILRNNLGRVFFFTDTLLSVKTEKKINPGEKFVGADAIRLQMDLSSKQGEIANLHTVQGSLIDCMFMIEVKAHTNGHCKCCGDEPCVESGFVIVPCLNIPPIAIEPPANWSPHVYEPVSMIYDKRFDSASGIKPEISSNIEKGPQGPPSYEQIVSVAQPIYGQTANIPPSYEEYIKNSQQYIELNKTVVDSPANRDNTYQKVSAKEI